MKIIGETIRIPVERQGQTGMGQGGYGCWRLQHEIGEPVTTALRKPLPLDTDLVVREHRSDDDQLRWTLIAPASPDEPILDARPWTPDVPDTAAVPIAAAAEARAHSNVAGDDHPAPHCLSCGTGERTLAVHAGALSDGRWATPLRLPEWTLIDGEVDQSWVWMAIDCGCGWFTSMSGNSPGRGVTVQYAVDVIAPLEPETDYSLVMWPGDYAPDWDGRKRGATAAIFAADGSCMARSRSFWVRPAA